MSIRKGISIIAGNGGSGSGSANLLDFKWADHLLNDVSWLRADTFSWQDGNVYSAVYQHLVADIVGKSLQSETIAGTTIQFYLADDGHKVTTDESGVLAIYNATGVAWYYVLDAVNTRFKLPRTKFGFTGIRDGVGKFVEAGLPNITGALTGQHVRSYISGIAEATSALYRGNNDMSYTGNYGPENSAGKGLYFDASRSNSIYGNSTTVQPKSTEMYLYFYVGNYTHSAIEQTAGLNAELFNGKADVNMVAHVVIEFQEPTAENSYTWYRKYADGWVEQGGTIIANNDAAYTQTLPVIMANTGYQVLITRNPTGDTTSTLNQRWHEVYNITTTTFTTWGKYYNYTTIFWEVKGMYAQE